MVTLDEVFSFIEKCLGDLEQPWVLTGSLAFFYQGIPVDPHDIDIQTTESGAYEIEKRLAEFIVCPVRFSESDTIRSHFGECRIHGVKVEIIGDIEKRDASGEWSSPVDLEHLLQFIKYKGLEIPVLPLAYEYQAYLKMGRREKAALLKQYL